jgi:RND family efflux transporter MFP subunit
MSDQLSADLQSLRINRGAPPARGNRVWGVIAVVALLVGGGFAVKKFALPYASAGLLKQEISITEVSLVSPTQGAVDLTTTGYVVPQSVAKVGAKVVGRVTKANVKEWDPVKADQVLFVLDPTDQNAAIASAQARVQAARARAQAARAQVTEVRLQYERENRLAESGAVSKAGAEDLRARVEAMNATARAADSEAAALQAEVASLQANLHNLVVKAPIDGVASTKPVQVGDVVRPDQILVEVSDMSSLMVEADVAEARIGLVKVNGPCEIILDAYPNKRHRGVVVEVSPILDRAKASAKVKVKFVDKVEEARGQMSVRVSFLQEEQKPEMLNEAPKKVVPSAAVVDRNGVKSVFVVSGDHVKLTPVKLGPPIGGGFELLDPIPPGTKLVRDPAPTLTDGQLVKEASSQ